MSEYRRFEFVVRSVQLEKAMANAGESDAEALIEMWLESKGLSTAEVEEIKA